MTEKFVGLKEFKANFLAYLNRKNKVIAPIGIWKPKNEDLTELTDVRECPACGGHVKLDETYLLQVSATVSCPYCSTRLLFVEIGDEVLVFQNDEFGFGGESRLEFVGTVVGFKEDGTGGFYTQVQDQDDDVFDLEPHEFELEDE